MCAAVRGQMIEVISAECKRNKILVCRAYVDMGNMMTRIRILASALNKSLPPHISPPPTPNTCLSVSFLRLIELGVARVLSFCLGLLSFSVTFFSLSLFPRATAPLRSPSYWSTLAPPHSRTIPTCVPVCYTHTRVPLSEKQTED